MKNEFKHSPSKIKESREQAFKKICEILERGDIENQFNDKSGDYYGDEKFIVTYIGNYKGMMAEYSLCKTDAFYKDMSGFKCIFTTQGLFHEHQFGGYPSIEMGLLKLGMNLLKSKKVRELEIFFDKYVKPYNERVKKITPTNK